MTVVTLQAALDRVNVEHDTDEAVGVLRLLRAISEEVESMTHRTWSTTDTYRDEVIDAKGLASVILSHVPVAGLLSVNRVYGDGTQETIDTPSRSEWDSAVSWTHAIDAAVAIGDNTVTLDDATDVAVGDHMLLADDEVVRVTDIASAPTIGFEPAARFANGAGSAIHVDGSVSWYLEDAVRGKVIIVPGRRLLRFIYRVPGQVVPYAIQEAALEWLSARWADKDVRAGLTAYTTGDDSETYDAGLAGNPPSDTARTLSRYWRRVRNGVV